MSTIANLFYKWWAVLRKSALFDGKSGTLLIEKRYFLHRKAVFFSVEYRNPLIYKQMQ